MLKTFRWISVVPSGLVLTASLAFAAPGDWVNSVRPIQSPKTPNAIALRVVTPTGSAAGASAAEAWAAWPGHRMVYNISKPKLVPIATAARAGGKPAATIIVVPGGGFEYLEIDNEGYDVARRLARLGLRVFLLEYRTLPMPDGFASLHAALVQTFIKGVGTDKLVRDMPFAVADTQAAIRMVRSHAKAWKIDPARIGILGFSAGAMTVLATAQANAADARPDFVGMLYGPTRKTFVPPHAPPLFAALAADDRFFGKDDFGLIEQWRNSGASVEFHLFSAGGHGFASQPNGTTSDGWFGEYVRWLRAQKIVGGHRGP
ncbi:MAG: alpha/beta hydrolase fold domain-containing protein [Gammaproteobacteria bacterium]|nr:alpha/beta hydrolase fold domain-containing protein [Gammaproteobacteria bacterium]